MFGIFNRLPQTVLSFLIVVFIAISAQANPNLIYATSKTPGIKSCLPGRLGLDFDNASYSKVDIKGPLPYIRTYNTNLSGASYSVDRAVDIHRSIGGWSDNYYNYMLVEPLSSNNKAALAFVTLKLPGMSKEAYFFVKNLNGKPHIERIPYLAEFATTFSDSSVNDSVTKPGEVRLEATSSGKGSFSIRDISFRAYYAHSFYTFKYIKNVKPKTRDHKMERLYRVHNMSTSHPIFTTLGFSYNQAGHLISVANNKGYSLSFIRDTSNNLIRNVNLKKGKDTKFTTSYVYKFIQKVPLIDNVESDLYGKESYRYDVKSHRAAIKTLNGTFRPTYTPINLPVITHVLNANNIVVKRFEYADQVIRFQKYSRLANVYNPLDGNKINESKVTSELRRLGVSYDINTGKAFDLIEVGYNNYNNIGIGYNFAGKPCFTSNGVPIKAAEINILEGLKSVKDYNGIETKYTYDDYKRVRTITEAVGKKGIERKTTYAYTVLYNGKPNLTTTPNTVISPNLKVVNVLNARGQIKTQTQTSSLANSQTKVTQYEYYEDSSKPNYGLLKKVNGPRTDVRDIRSYTYDNYGNLATETFYVKRNDKETAYTERYYDYNSAGQPAYKVGANGKSVKYTYDAGFRVKTETSGKGYGKAFRSDGIQMSYDYDELGRKKKETLPDGETLEYDYDSIGRVSKVTKANGDYETYHYHSNNELHYKTTHKVTRGSGYATSPNGLLYLGSLPRISISDYYIQKLDKNGRVNWTRSGLSENYNETSFIYDANGNVTEEKTLKPSKTKSFVITKTDYDALNRPYKVTYPNGDVKTIKYQKGMDNVENQTAANGSGSTQSKFTDTTLLQQESNSDFGQLGYLYDKAGNVTKKTNARGAYCNYNRYDQLGRMGNESCSAPNPQGSFRVSDVYDYDGTRFGRLDRVRSTNNSIHSNKGGFLGTTTDYVYDDQDRVTQKIQRVGFTEKFAGQRADRGVSYGYTKGGKLNAMTLPSGNNLSFSYNNVGQVSGVRLNNKNLMSNLTYDGADRLTGWTWGNGLTTTQTINNTNQYKQTETKNGSSSLFKLGYDYYLNSQIKSQSINGGSTQTYTYDDIGQLTEESGPAFGSFQGYIYTYDSNGNRKSKSIKNTNIKDGAHGFDYDLKTNRLNRWGKNRIVQEFSHTCDGVLIQKQNRWNPYPTKTGYDYKNRRVWEHTDSHNAGAKKSFMQYNHKNERTMKYADGQYRVYVYDEASHLIGEYTADGKLVVEYVWLGDKPVAALYPSSRVVYLLTDHQNKARRGIESSNKQVVWAWDPDAFGVRQPHIQKVTVNLRFPGQYYDAQSGLYYNHNRYYDPKLGRYVEPDPIGLEGGMNPYAYVGNDPVNNTDSTGLYIDPVTFMYIPEKEMNPHFSFKSSLGFFSFNQSIGGYNYSAIGNPVGYNTVLSPQVNDQITLNNYIDNYQGDYIVGIPDYLHGTFTFNAGVGVGVSANVKISNQGVRGTVIGGVGVGLGATATVGAHKSNMGDKSGFVSSVSLNGGAGFGGSGKLTTGVPGVSGDASIGVGLGFGVVSGMGYSGLIYGSKKSGRKK